MLGARRIRPRVHAKRASEIARARYALWKNPQDLTDNQRAQLHWIAKTDPRLHRARRLVRASDRCVIEAGGLVGRHVGDGVVAFFLAETCGSESAAARSCIEAMRSLRAAVADVAAASDLEPDDLMLRFGLHWGSTLYVGGITTSGRSEVTALGDEANEAARIEACATGGRILASKTLIERLDADDSAALDIDPDRMSYSILGELSTASEKGPAGMRRR